MIISSEGGKPMPMPPEPKIDESLPKDVIEYKGRLFEVPQEVIMYLEKHPDVLPMRIGRAELNGMIFMYFDGGYACEYCNHYAYNLGVLVTESLEKRLDSELEQLSLSTGLSTRLGGGEVYAGLEISPTREGKPGVDRKSVV